MNEKRTALLTVCLLGAFLLTFSLWAYLKPDDAFSQSERRKLTQKPSCTFTVADICLISRPTPQINSLCENSFGP